MEKITYAQLAARFCQHESACPTEYLSGCIVFTEDSFEKPYPLEAWSFAVSSDNKAYQPNMGGYSISMLTAWTAVSRASAWSAIWPQSTAARTAGAWSIAT